MGLGHDRQCRGQEFFGPDRLPSRVSFLHLLIMSERSADDTGRPEGPRLALEDLEGTDFFPSLFLISPASFGVFTLDDRRFIGVNDGFAELIGYEEQTVVGQTAEELGINMAYEDREKIFERLRRGEVIRKKGLQIRTADGEVCRVLGSFFCRRGRRQVLRGE